MDSSTLLQRGVNNIIHAHLCTHYYVTSPVMAAEATGLGFVCFVVINPCVLLANRVDFGLFFIS